ncbi:hypothetical protein K440DRAFT_583928 [Wilcoxina mikolae CBS 423.85]|nr:hypothetical protein K440DRAFT_583928 [Wilcoxina mikolae CBS 423.85]
MFSGWDNDQTRMDVVVISWRTPRDLRRLTLQVAMQLESIAFGTSWEVLVCGRKLSESSQTPPKAYWIQSPRCSEYSTTRIVDTQQPYFPITPQLLANATASFFKGSSINQVIRDLVASRECRPSRCAYVNDVPEEVQQDITPARFFTHFQNREVNVPFVQLRPRIGQFGHSRAIVMDCAKLMYSLLHLAVAVAVGLMAAATGRGLAVWLMAVRATLKNLGTSDILGDEALMVFLAWDKVTLEWETLTGSWHVAGDAVAGGVSSWKLVWSMAVPILEVSIICAGWAYGSWDADKLRPSGVVGHGMLGLSLCVAIALSFRAAVGVKRRTTGRLIGTSHTQRYTRYTIGPRRVTVPVEPMLRLGRTPDELHLLAHTLNDSADDNTAIIAAMCILRSPSMANTIPEYLSRTVLQYHYDDDAIVTKGSKYAPLKARDVYPWIQSTFCIVLTALCACASVVYAYWDVPVWVKPLVEVLLVLSASWFSVLERADGLCHDRDAYVSFMIATLVSSGLWYVGVNDIFFK